MNDEQKPLLKKFGQSKFAEFVREKVKPVIGDVLEVVGDITGKESIERVGQLLNDRKESNDQAKALSWEFEKYKLEWQLELESMKMEHGLAEMKAQNEEMANVRDREIKYMQQSGGKRDWIQGSIAIFIMIVTAYMIIFLSFWEVPKSNERLFDMLLGGMVVSSFIGLREFYFGSSKSSHRKDETISKLTKTQ